MSLIKCPDCGKEYSSYAKACPECGCPVEYCEPVDKNNGEIVAPQVSSECGANFTGEISEGKSGNVVESAVSLVEEFKGVLENDSIRSDALKRKNTLKWIIGGIVTTVCLAVGIVFISGYIHDTHSMKSEPQTPCNNPQVLVETFASYMRNKDYENASLLFVEFKEKSYSLQDLYNNMELLKIGNVYAVYGLPTKIEVIESGDTYCLVITATPFFGGGEWYNHFTLKKVNDCWQIAEYGSGKEWE